MYASTHADVPLTPEQRASEMARLDAALQGFTLQMREHLRAKLDAGWRGWDNPDNGREIWNAMLAHAAGVPMAKGQEVGIANFAMFLWFQRIEAVRSAQAATPTGQQD
jgi:hypothetical protein